MFAKLRIGLGAGLVFCIALFAGAGRVCADALTTNQIHMYSQPAVVQIISGWTAAFSVNGERYETNVVGVGAGMLITPDGYILTNAHVVAPTHDGDETGARQVFLKLCAQLAAKYGSTFEQVRTWLGSQSVSRLEFHRVNQVVFATRTNFTFEIKSYGHPTGAGTDLDTGKDVAVIKVEMRNAPTVPLGESANVQVGDKVWVIGFPGAATSSTFNDTSNMLPSTTEGTISAVGKRTRDGVPVLQTNAAATHGNSGGPVLNDQGEVIGLLTFRGELVNQQEVQGFNFIVPIDTAKEFIGQAGTTARAHGPVDARWREALADYWNHDYEDAKETLQELVELNEQHEEAKQLLRNVDEQIILGNGNKGLGVMGYGLLVAGALGAAAAIQRRRKSRGPSGSRPAAPTPAAGRSVDAVPAPAAPRPTPQRTEFAREDSALRRKGATVPYSDVAKTAEIVWSSGPLAGQARDVGFGLSIGREPSAARVVVPDPEISALHAWIGLRGPELVFVDRESTNGSYVNGRQVAANEFVELKDADVVVLGRRGSVSFTVRLGEAPVRDFMKPASADEQRAKLDADPGL